LKEFVDDPIKKQVLIRLFTRDLFGIFVV